jgi:hypothetical protein
MGRYLVQYEIEAESERDVREGIPDEADCDYVALQEDKPTDGYVPPTGHTVLVCLDDKDVPSSFVLAKVTGWARECMWVNAKHLPFPQGEIVMLAHVAPRG